MKDYQLRVIEERDDLKIKLDKLISFSNTDKFYQAPMMEQLYLEDQADYMEGYLETLNRRIEFWKKGGRQ